jgi:hypothetical protein
MVIAFVGCTIVGSLVNAIAQITFFEGMVEIVIAIMAIPIATLVDHATAVITVIVVVVSSIIVPVVAVVVVPVVTAVVVSTTIMTTVSGLTVVWWVVA